MTPYDLPDYHAMIRHIRDVDRAGGDSTLARKVVADWLEEQEEEERATLIRLMVQHRQTPGLGLFEDCCCLLRDHGERWLPKCLWPTRSPTAARGTEWQALFHNVYRDGFADSVSCLLADWLTHGPDICRRHPVREVVITDKWPYTQYGSHHQWMATQNRDGSGQPWHLPFFLLERLAMDEGPSRPPMVADLNAAALRWAEAEADRPA